MKKLLAIICTFLIAFCAFSGCNNETQGNDGSMSGSTVKQPTSTPYLTPAPTPAPEDIKEATDYVTEQWMAVDIPFEANKNSENIKDTLLDVTFINRSTGTKLVMPGFWDGENDWIVRFAPTECGIWDYETVTTGEDVGISGIKGTLACNAYKGDLAIYQHGFVKTEPGKKYFVYADGTPFFYLGDTHWNMITEEFDSAGPYAGDIETDSHFKYIVDRRVEQGFTVYQSEPIGASYIVDDGAITKFDISGFKEFDKYFQYIAEKGLVHANAQLIFPSSASDKFSENVESLTRYWVARYAAYPVMWTLGQEVDDGRNMNIPTLTYTYSQMCEFLYKYDPYKNPTSAHQLNTAIIGCKGGVPYAAIDAGGSSNFNSLSDKIIGKNKASVFLAIKGHTWWAAQWRPTVHTQYNFGMARDYWEYGSDKPIVCYEARYHMLSATDFGARAQAWIAYLSGMYGHGYGGQDMWLYKGTYDDDIDSSDGTGYIPKELKASVLWSDLINANISNELYLMRGFFENVGWWNLVPDFDDGNAFKKVEGKEGFYAAAYNGNEVYVVYLYNRTTDSAGKLVNMDKNAVYVAQWFDTRTGEYILIDYNLRADANGEYDIPEKPVADDMILLVTKK